MSGHCPEPLRSQGELLALESRLGCQVGVALVYGEDCSDVIAEGGITLRSGVGLAGLPDCAVRSRVGDDTITFAGTTDPAHGNNLESTGLSASRTRRRLNSFLQAAGWGRGESTL